MIIRALQFTAQFVLVLCIVSCTGPGDDGIVIYTARNILTFDPANPSATAVAVQGDRIVAVGATTALEAKLAGQGARVDERFAGKVLLPGFIDPHIHPTIAATILPMEIVAAMSWPTKDGYSEPVRDARAFHERLQQLDKELSPGEWLMAWGYHAPYHGPLNKRLLNDVSSDRPIMIWQRSVHEMYFNSRALEELGLNEKAFAETPHANWEDGHLWETGLFTLGKPMMRKIAAPRNYLSGLALMSDLIHRGGVTTVGEQGFPQASALLEYWSLRWALRDRPLRFVLVPNAMFLSDGEDSAAGVLSAAEDLLGRSVDQVRVVKHVKYYADGAIYSQLMQMTEPYLDGHHGEWMMPPEQQREVLETFWRNDWDIHIHVNGDAGLDNVLNDLARLRRDAPGHSPHIVLEHYGYARADQHQRVKALGVEVSSNPYYLHELAPIYATHGLGPARAENIAPLGGLQDVGVRFSFHSDFTMAPLEPLTLAWVAVNRVASDGQVWGEHQRISLDTALAAITIEAARSLGMENEIGSIEPGKKADFTVLDKDPYEVPLRKLNGIGIWGTIFEGKPYPLGAP